MKFGEMQFYEIGAWVQLRGIPNPGRIEGTRKEWGGIEHYDVRTLNGVLHIGCAASSMKPWERQSKGGSP